MNYWLTSDTHFGHFNIIRYCGRPFKSLDDMNQTMIRKWNERVKPEDHVFFLGDFCFKNSSGGKSGEGVCVSSQFWIDKLNGNKTFIKGNHDRNNSLKCLLKSGVIEYAGEKYFLVHSPQDASQEFKICFCGHVHERFRFKKYKSTILINVGVDVNDFYPRTIDEHLIALKKYMKNC